jgi:hypothetical protein
MMSIKVFVLCFVVLGVVVGSGRAGNPIER